MAILCASAASAPQSPAGSAPQPSPTPLADSLLDKNTLLTIYGRSFARAPVLGKLGMYAGFDAMEKDIKQWTAPILEHNDKKGVVPAVHLIYAMAIPCTPKIPSCLLYLDGNKRNDLVKEYIEPAAKRGWAVILDSQLGRSNPADQVKRMIDKGYLKYENVHVAIDPEFHSYPGRNNPGVPIGTVQASEINQVQEMLDEYVRTEGLRTRKIVIVHQFGDANVKDGVPFMIQNKKSLKTWPNVDLVIDMDGLGAQAVKVHKYNKITDATVYPFLRYRGIKIFYPNPYEKGGHHDRPPLTIEQIFGKAKAKNGPRMATKPDVITIA
jgi:hypothetical protein